MAEDPEEVVRQAEVMERFLGDELIQKVFRDIHMTYYEQMKAADDPAAAAAIWSRGRALDDLSKVLQGVVDKGVLAKRQLEQQGKPSVY